MASRVRVLAKDWKRLAWFLEDNYLYLTGRLDRILKTGYHVYPQEIEETIRELPEVRDVLVKGEPDPVRGERVVAVIATSAVTHEELISSVDTHVRSRLASYKVPRKYTVVDELPNE